MGPDDSGEQNDEMFSIFMVYLWFRNNLRRTVSCLKTKHQTEIVTNSPNQRSLGAVVS